MDKFIEYYLFNEFRKYNISLNILKLLIVIIDKFYLKFDGITWDKTKYIKNSDVQFVDNEHKIKLNGHTKYMLIDYVFTKKEFKKLVCEFIMYEYSYRSWIGFIKYPLNISSNDEVDINCSF